MANYIGQQFGNYRLVKLLGEGGFAEVYLGEHVHLSTLSAVKVLTTKLTGEGIDFFREEARTIISLDHPNIVRIYDFGIQDRIPYLIMNYAPNGSLRRLHPRGIGLPIEKIVSYVKQIAAAFQYAHNLKLIHRDIKPDNMLLGRNNEVLLSDFGIAVIAHSTRSLNTQDGSGTLAYMAPEQIQGKPRIASDQYALGIVVYEWLNGRPPFTGTATEIGMQHLLTPPPSLRENVPTISPAVEKVVMTALEKDPHKRFASIQTFATALEEACQTALFHPVPLPTEIGPSSSPLLSSKTNAPVGKEFVIPPIVVTDKEEESQDTRSHSKGRLRRLVRRFSPVLVPLPFAILIFLFTLPFALRGQAFLPLLPLGVVLIALVVLQATLLYYARSKDTYWTLWVMIGYGLFLVVGTLAIFGFGISLVLLFILLIVGRFLYWLLRSSVQKQVLGDGQSSSSPACKHRRVGVQSDVVTSILMLERRYSHLMEKLLLWVVFSSLSSS